MATTVFDGTASVLEGVGRHLGYSDWLAVDQERVNQFAEATGDHQWIHVDVERARRESPFGGPIAHGYLTLSLVNYFLPQILEVRGISLGVNYGLDKVRFPAPVPVGSRLRAGGELTAASAIEGGVAATVRVTVERQDGDRPVCVAETLSRFLD
jgi:acyl dehydratase